MLVEGADILCLKNQRISICNCVGSRAIMDLFNYMYFQSFLKIAQVAKCTIHINQKVEIMHHEKSDKQFLGSCFAKSKTFIVHGV